MKSKRLFGGLFLTLAILVAPPRLCLSSPEQPTVDEMFQQARKLAFSGKKEEARRLCLTALERSPDYSDIRILLGRLYSWDGMYEQGRAELKKVVEKDPTYVDGRDALVDLELWSDNPQTAVKVCDEGLALDPKNQILLYKKARALKNTGNKEAAIIVATTLLQYYPDNEDARALLDDLKGVKATEGILLDYTYDSFDKTFTPWNEVALTYRHRFDFGPVLGRINLANRFGESAAQVEVDAYPHIREGTYAYLNAGYSNSGIFPSIESGGEVYQSLGRAYEASLGYRFLRFSSNILIFTGTLGKYWGSYYFAIRPYVTPSSIGSSASATLLIRRYFGGEDYMTLQIGGGVSPDQLASTLAIYQAADGHASLNAYVELFKNFFGSISVSADRQEIFPDDYRYQYELGLGIEKRF